MRGEISRWCNSVRCVVILIVVLPVAAAGQDLRTPRLLSPNANVAGTISRRLELEQRFLAASGGWSFYHRVEDLPPAIRDVLVKAAPRIVDTGESFNTGDEGGYGSWNQHLFSAATDDLWVMVWYAGGFNGPQLKTLLYDPMVRDAHEYGFGKTPGAISLEPELKNLVRHPEPGRTQRYLPPGTL